ncbi:unnamed protein product [Vitrella brassicaformis CCMP3155]|uniref:Uncharacterized protein n=1 Tax=Vitrella brassicaformis (strain CCMP3155) TaxID=1169540 RepID=A0A0G4FGW3_VITBC|nr:unnamed protein product [Vitrella brassicaformis CCMP3155]|eukprot:CEM12694.1 unnamed protein product [Vitrella brassicaformis CCMP3155]
MMSGLEQKHSEISCLMYRLSALDPSDLSSHDCSLHMIAALDQYAKLRATLKALVKSATFPAPRTDASAKLEDLPADAMGRLQTSTDLTSVGRLKTTARLIKSHIRDALRSRLTDATDKAGLRGVVRFAPQLGDGGALKALWLMEEGGDWGEVGDGLRFAGQSGYCQLPITIDARDLQKHDTKTAYVSMPRVAAQWMIVGRHVVFRRRDGQQDGTFELFRDPTTNEIRAIRDEPDFAVTLNPPLSTDHVHPLQQHPFQQHLKRDDPPVRSAIGYTLHGQGGWVAIGLEYAETSVSTFIVDVIMYYHSCTHIDVHHIHGIQMEIDCGVRGGYLDTLLTRSPHTPLEGCSAVVTTEEVPVGSAYQTHLLTAFDDPFIAWVQFRVRLDHHQTVTAVLATTEQPVGSPYDAFPVRHPQTTARARRSLGFIAPVFLDGQTP